MQVRHEYALECARISCQNKVFANANFTARCTQAFCFSTPYCKMNRSVRKKYRAGISCAAVSTCGFLP